MVRVWLPALLVSVIGAAALPEPPLATFLGGEVRLSDVQREIRFLRQDEARYRGHVGLSQAASWEDWIRRAALRAMARDTALAEGLTEDPVIREQARRQGREWLLERWAAECYGFAMEVPDDPTLEAGLQGEPRTLAPRILVSHIFLRTATPEEDVRAEATLRQWRREIAGADSFAEYARRHSQSQTASNGGRIGYVHPGTLPAAADAILFALPAGAMSEPIRLHGGWHLFLVHENLPERPAPQDRRIERARARAISEARVACRRRRLATSPFGSIASGAAGDAELSAVDWQVGRDLLLELYGSEGQSPDETVARYVEDEALYQLALGDDGVDADMRRHIEDLADDVYLGAILQRQVASFLTEPSDGDLRALAATRDHPLQRRKQMRLGVLRTPIPEDGDPLAFLDGLVDLAHQAAAGGIDLDAALDELPDEATEEELPLLDIYALAGGRLEPVVFDRIKNLPAGSVSSPIQLGKEFYVVAVREVIAGRDRTFEEARPDLHRLWRRERSRELKESIIASVLERYHFEITASGRDKLAALAAADGSAAVPPSELP
jgi:parvulin-like peptidyl-prolyl isomerase